MLDTVETMDANRGKVLRTVTELVSEMGPPTSEKWSQIGRCVSYLLWERDRITILVIQGVVQGVMIAGTKEKQYLSS